MNGIDPGQTPQEFYDYCSSSDDGLFSRYADLLFSLEVSARSFLRPNLLDDLIAGGVPPIPAGDLVEAFREKFHKSKNLSVFWDFENVRPDFKSVTGQEVMDALSRRLQIFGKVVEVHVYAPEMLMQQALSMPGAIVHSVPHMNRTEVADKMLIVDAISFSFNKDHKEPPVVCIISCDSDFSALISKLQMLNVRTIAVTEDGKHVRSIGSVASMVTLSWPSDFGLASRQSRLSGGGRHYQKPPDYNASTKENTTSNDNDKSPASLHPNARLLMSTPLSSTLTLPFPRSRSRSPISTPLLRRNSEIFATPSCSFTDDDVTTSSSDTEFLAKVLASLENEAGNRHIQRNRVAAIMRRSLGSVSFSSLVSRAVNQGIVEEGGAGAMAWLGLKKTKHPDAAGDQNQQQESAEATGDFYLSYRLLKNRANSKAILSIKPEEVAPFEIVDTEDSLDSQRFSRRAFGPFTSEAKCYQFAASLRDASVVVPRVLRGKPKNP